MLKSVYFVLFLKMFISAAAISDLSCSFSAQRSHSCSNKQVITILSDIQGVTGGTDQTSGGCSLC